MERVKKRRMGGGGGDDGEGEQRAERGRKG